MSYNNKRDGIEERVYSVTMTEEELSLFSEFLEQKEFNSKAQKARRRKFDLEQGLSSKANEHFIPRTSNPLEAIKLSDAERLRAHNTSIQQGNRVGIKKTSDLLDKATKNTKTDFFKGDMLTLTNPSEIREVTNAQNLIRAGRQRSSTGNIHTHFEVNSNNGQSLNRLINRRGKDYYLDSMGDISTVFGKRNSRKALQEAQSVKPKKVVEQVKTEAQSVKPKKVVEQVKTEAQSVKPKKVNPALKGKVADLRKISKLKKTGKTAVAIAIPVAAVGTGVAVYKKHKKNKDKKKEENN